MARTRLQENRMNGTLSPVSIQRGPPVSPDSTQWEVQVMERCRSRLGGQGPGRSHMGLTALV